MPFAECSASCCTFLNKPRACTFRQMRSFIFINNKYICVFEGMWMEKMFYWIPVCTCICICAFVFWRSMRIENEINLGWIPACTWQQMVRSNTGKLTSIIQYALIWQITITRSRKANVSDAFLLKFYHVKKTQLAYHLKSIVGLCGLIWWIYIII